MLLKAVGKCTTDHISPAGPWLTYRGHLTNICGNLFLGANNAFADKEPGLGVDVRDGSVKPFPSSHANTRPRTSRGSRWATRTGVKDRRVSTPAMEPRYMGCKVILVRSFARIHEANLKKQGVLPLTFVDPTEYDKVQADDTVDVVGLARLAPGTSVTVVLHHADGSADEIVCNHTMSPEHIEWFKAGSALNLLAAHS